jgi:hypothetical protein
MNSTSLALACFFLVAGCATITDAQQERQKLFNEVNSVVTQSQNCYNALTSEQRFAPLYSKFSLRRKPATQSELGDSGRVSEEFVRLILDWYAAHQKCDNVMLSGFGKADGRLEIVAIKWLQDRARLLEKIVRQRPTYGQVNAELDVLKIREAKEYKDWLSKTENSFSTKHANEIVERERVAKQRQEAFFSTASNVAEALFEGLVTLATIQVSLASAQQQYAASRPTTIFVEPIQPKFSTTRCSRDAWGGVSCSHF